MVKAWFGGLILFGILFLSVATAQAQNVEASVDREELVRGETVTLTLRVFGQQGGVQMDLTPLEENFDIIVTRTSSQMRSVNGRTEAWTDYILTLFPRNTGTLEIPSLSIAGQTTQAMQVEVLPQTQTSITAGQALFLEAVVNKDTIFVQEQLLFNIRLYYTINGIRNPQFTELNMDEAVIQMIGSPNQYEKLIDGVRYGVYEKQYVIFPQRSGTLTIPDIVFRGEVADGSSNFVFRNLNTRTITAFAEGHEITVKERPASYPVASTWLPASNILLEEEWSADISNLKVGDTVTRTITVTANGLDGAALPPLELPTNASFNVYPDTPVIERTFIDGNIVGTRIESQTMVATQSGSVEIPAIDLPWWDVESEEMKTASIPSSFIRVAPEASATASILEAEADGALTDAAEQQTDGVTAANSGDELIEEVGPSLWIMALAVLITAGLMLAWSLARRRNRRIEAVTPSIKRAPISEAYRDEIARNKEAAAFNKLQQACNESDAVKVRLALIAWGRQYFQDARLYTLDDLFAHIGSEQIRSLANRLIGSIYGQNAGAEMVTGKDYKELAQLISTLRKDEQKSRRMARKKAEYSLPPLYRS